MRFYCQHRNENGEQCKRYALSKRDYCRWHLIPRQYRDYSHSWGKALGIICMLFGLIAILEALAVFLQFLSTARVETFFFTVFYGSFSAFLISYGVLMGGSFQIVWSKIYAVSFGVLAVTFAGFAILGTISQDFAKSLIAQLFPQVASLHLHPLLLISTIVIIAVYLISYFLSTVLFVRIPQLFHQLVLAAYLLIWAFMIFFSATPLWQTLLFFLFVAYLLDSKFGLLKRLRDMLRF